MTERNDNLTEVIDGRHDVYGDPKIEMPNVAKVWSGITGHEITPEMIPLMLIGYKLVRARRAPDYSDNSDDVEGYLDIFRTVVGEDMIHARSVTEYLQLKEQQAELEEGMAEQAAQEELEQQNRAEPDNDSGDVHQWSITSLDFHGDTFVYNQLHQEGIITIGALTELTRERLLAMPNLGARRLLRIELALAEFGLSLRES